MKYVKSKIVKKIKTDQIPQQVADKYIDIYKELIDKEAQRKQDEQDFLRRQRGAGTQGAYGVIGGTSLIGQVNPSQATLSQNSQGNNAAATTSRNKSHTRSD